MNNIDFLPINIREDNTYWGSESLSMNLNFNTIRDFLDYIRRTTFLAQTNTAFINNISELDGYTIPGSYSVSLNRGVSGELPSLNGAYDFTLNVFKANNQGNTIIQQQIFNHQVYQRVVPEDQWERNTFSDIERKIIDKLVQRVDINNTSGSFLKNPNSAYKLGLLNDGKPVYIYNDSSNNQVVEELATKGWVNKVLEEGGITPGPNGFATVKYVDDKIASLVNSSPEALDTLKELADALGNDPNFATTVLNKIAAIENLWKIDDKGRLYSDMVVYSTKSISAKGVALVGGGSGGGINETLLWSLLGDGDNPDKQIALSHLSKVQTWATSSFVNQSMLAGYATQSWVQSQGYLTSNSLTNYVVKEPGKGLSTNDFTDTYKSKLDSLSSYVLPPATSSRLGGIMVGNGLVADASGILSTNLSEGNLPAISISKVTGLQTSLNSKLDASIFNDLFEKVNIGTDSTPKYIIRAKYGMSTNFTLSAKGIAQSGGSGGGGINEQLLWAILANEGTEQIAKNHLTTALSGYVLSTDIRLSNARPASDVYEWAKQINKPTYSYSEITGTPPAVDLSNYVTLDTDQNIKGPKSFSGKVLIYNSALDVYNGFELQGTSTIAPNMTFHFPRKHANMLFMDYASRLNWDGLAVYAKAFAIENGTASKLLRADGGVASFNWIAQPGQPAWLWGGNTPHDYYVYNPSIFRVANADSVGDISASNLMTTNTNQDIWSQKNFKYGFGIGSGSFGNNGFFEGTGDGATFDTYNFYLKGWYGMAFKDYADNVTGIYNFRNGLLTLNGGFARTGGTRNQLLAANGDVNVFEHTPILGQPDYVWGTRGVYDYVLYSPANFNVAGAGYIRVGRFFDPNNHTTDDLKFNVYDCYNIEGTPTPYGNVLEINSITNHWKPQLWFDAYRGNRIRYRNRGYNDTGFEDWRVLAFITDNVASATVLQTARSIWGQPFKGDSNIEGPMYGVRSIAGLAGTSIDYFTNRDHHFYIKGGTVNSLSIVDNGNVGIGIIDPTWKLYVNGDTYTNEWFRVKHSRGLYIQDASVYYTNTANYACISSNGNEIVFSGADDMYVNYRGDGTTGRLIPKKWYWRAGTPNSWAGMEIGNLGVNGNLVVSGRLDLGMASFQYDPIKKMVKLILSDGTPCGFAATGQLAAKGVAPATSRGLNDTQVYNEVFSLREDSNTLRSQIANLNAEIILLKNKVTELTNKLPS